SRWTWRCGSAASPGCGSRSSARMAADVAVPGMPGLLTTHRTVAIVGIPLDRALGSRPFEQAASATSTPGAHVFRPALMQELKPGRGDLVKPAWVVISRAKRSPKFDD